MANNQSTFVLKLETKGMNEAQRSSKDIRENLEGAQKAASATKVARSAAAQPTGMAGVSAGIGGREVQEYAQASGVSGKAGGSARDFADQARGLGGLVRLYATVAANAFAAAAAFNALSTAMDTTNMVKGLDQLGASSGKALGTLSKRLVEATDGAVNLREAMEATAKASSAGLDSSQILRLGEVAKKSSQALGVSMPDALNRLSRGISKIEPELLDELGIYVKIDDAAEKYAKTLGRTASSLSDYERRQAFANEVLAQAEQKFSSIKIDSNPYNKLLATLQNVTQAGLEFVNKFLAPLAGLLAENSKAVGLLLGVVGLKLIGSALPALTQWRQGIAAAAIDAKKSAQEISEAYGAAFVRRWENSLNVPALEKQVKAAQTELNKLSKPTTLRAASVERVSTLGAAAEAADIDRVNRLLKDKESRLKGLADSQKAEDVRKAQAYTQEKLYLEQLIARTRTLTEATKALETAREGVQTAADAPVGPLSGEAARRRNVQDATAKANRLEALSSVATVTAAGGFSEAMKNLNKDIEEKGIKGFNKFRTVGTGAFISLATSAGIFLKSLMRFIPYVGTAIMAFEIFEGLLGSNSKQVDKFNSGLDTLKDSVKLVQSTVEELNKQDIGRAFSAESSMAKANALSEVANSISDVSKAFFEATTSASGWDKAWDSIFSFFGGGLQKNLSKNIASAVDSAILALPKGKASENYEKAVRDILNVENLDTGTITKALKGLSEQDAAVAVMSIAKVTKAAMESQKAQAAALAEGSGAFKKIQEAQQALEISLKDTSQSSNYANALVSESARITTALKDPRNALILLNEVVGDTSKLSLLDPKTVQDLVAAESEIKQLAADTRIYEQQLEDARVAKQKLAKVNLGTEDKPVISIYASEQERKDFNLLVDTIKKGEIAVTLKTDLEQKAAGLAERFSNISQGAFEKGIEITTRKFQDAVAKAQLTVQTAMLSGVTGPGRADIDTGLRQQQIELDKRQITTAFEQIKALKENTLATIALKNSRDIEIQTAKVKASPTIQQIEELGRLEQEGRDISAQLGLVRKGLKATEQDFRDLGKNVKGANEALYSYFQSLQGAKGQLAGKEAESKAAEIEGGLKKDQERFQLAQKQLQAKIDTANKEREIATIVSGIYGIESQRALDAKIAAENKAQELQDTKSREEIENRLTINAKTYGAITVDIAKSGKQATAQQKLILDGLLQSVNAAGEELRLFDQGVEERARLKKINDDILKISSNTAIEQKKLDFDKQRSDSAFELQQISVNAAKQEFDSLVSRGLVSEQYAANRTAQLATEAQQIQYNKQLSDAAAQKRLQDLQAEDQYKKAIAAGGNELDALIEWGAQTAKNNTLSNERVAIIEANNTSAIRGIELTRQQALETAKQNEELKKQAEILGLFQGIADTLAQAFGKTGEVLGKFVGTIGEVIDNQETYNKKRAEQSKIIDEVAEKEKSGFVSAEDVAKMNQAIKTRGDLDKKNAKDEITNNAKILGSAKTLFKEKTAAYKILGALEKTMHIARIAMDFKELATSLFVEKGKLAGAVAGEAGQTAATGAGFFARAGLYITEIFAKISAQLGIFGPPVAAGIIAAIGLSAFGGKGKAPVAGSSAKERQEVQGGTGMAYDSEGKKVETGGGVFGDPTAKSDSIKKSLQLIAATSVEGITYQNKTVKLLESIDRSIGGAAQSLYGVIGVRAGTGFGTKEGTSSSGIQGLFGSKTTREIIDSGIKFAGSFLDVLSGKSGAVQQYETTRTTKKSSGFLGIGGSTSTSENTLTRALDQVDQKAATEITRIFSNAGDLFVELGGNLGKTQDDIFRSLAQVDLTGKFASLRGLQGEDLQKELGNVISGILDDAATVAFKSLERFRKFGEGMAETVVRVLDTNEKISQSFIAMGGKTVDSLVKDSFGTVTETIRTWYGAVRTVTREATAAELKEKSIEITEGLAELAGGLDKFLDKQKFFVDKFLTEAERLAPIRESLTTQLKELGLDFVDTREEFKQVVLAAKNEVGTEAGQAFYNSLLDLAPAIDQVYGSTEKTITVEEMRAKVLNQQLSILKLLGKDEEVLALQRAEELAELAKYPKAQADILIANQKYIYALEDEKSLKDKLIKQRDKERTALNNIINSLKSSITTLDNYRLALAGGDKSILTPLEKYQQNQTEFLKLQATAQGPAVTEAERAAQADAISKLPAAADKFLESSRTLFASSDRYTTDFNSVMSTVETTSASLTAQKSTAELQLDQLESSTSFLDAIQGNTYTTAELLQQYFAQQQTTQTLAQSATLPEPQQPEEVKEVTDKGVIAEIVKSNVALEQLRLEIEKLRTEQQAQTGAIIASNAQVVNNNADTVSDAIQNSGDFQYWYGRQVVDLP